MKMTLKRIVSLSVCLLILCISLSSLAACSAESNKVTKLYVYNWGEYISDGSEGSLDSNKAFEEWYYEEYGERIEVVYSTFSSNEDMYAKITTGAVSYDVIVPSDYMIERLIKEERLLPLDYENIPNIVNIIPEFYGKDAIYDYYDEGNIYSVPYFYGMIGIIYNTEMVDDSIEEDGADDTGSWDLMWNEKYAGNILQFNNPRDAFGTAQYFHGLDVNSEKEAEWRKALGYLRDQKDIVQGYVMDEIFNKMQSGSAAISAYYAGDFLTMYEENDALEFYYPKEGTNLYVDAMCIPDTCQNKVAAERYINFMLSEEPAIANAEYTYYASPNRLVRENQDYIDSMNEIKPDAYEKIYNTEGVIAKPYKNLSGKQLAMINTLWEELKSDIDVSPAIYIICAVIVATLVFFGVFFGVRKKIRNNY